MLTAESIKKVNEQLATTDIKGKPYVMVNERIRAFREICPGGTITTEIISLDNGVVTMKATITDENGQVISTGLAYEKESNGYINKTSFIENCETSAVGRALGFAGIGVDESMASAEEVVNAIINQDKQQEKSGRKSQATNEPSTQTVDKDRLPHGEGMTEERISKIKAEIERTGIASARILATYGVKDFKDMTEEQYIAAINILLRKPDKS